jgi:regulatory protein
MSNQNQADSIVRYLEVPRMPHLIEVAFEQHDAVILPLSAWVVLNLKVGMPVPDELFQKLELEAGVTKAKEQALGFLRWKPRTCREVVQYLEKKQYESSVCQRVVDDLKQLELLDDIAYASLYVQQKLSQASRKAISWKLEQRGLARDVIHSALDMYYPREVEVETARAVALKYSGKGNHGPLQKRKQKLGMYLQRQGFPSSLVRQFMRDLADVDVEDGFLDND